MAIATGQTATAADVNTALGLRILKSVLAANSVIMSVSSATPVGLAVAASRIVGRKSSGNIKALTGAEALTITGGVGKSIFDAHTLLIAISDNTPIKLDVASSRIVGRKSSGNIVALTGTELRTLIGWTDEKLLKGAGAGVAPDLIDVPASMPNDFTNLSDAQKTFIMVYGI